MIRMSIRIPNLLLLILTLLFLAACGGATETPSETPAADQPAATQPTAALSPGTASITGIVHYEGDVPSLNPVTMDADPACAAKHDEAVKNEVLVLGEGNTMANVLVKVKSGLSQGTWAVPSDPVVLDQVGCQYIPHVLGVMAGQTLKILNSDGLLHNVHALPEVNQEFNIGMPPNRTEADHVFTATEEPFRIKCDVHPWMGAFVAVLDHPFYSLTGKDGQFTISKLPAGSYEIEAWHERLGTQTASLTVADGESKSIDFTFSR